MDEMALTRSKSKHPPSKTVAEQRKIKAKVDTSDKKRRQKMTPNTRTPEEIEEIRATMAMPAPERIARLQAAMNDLDKQAAVTNTGSEEMRLSGARLLDEEALRLTQDEGDYSQGMRRAMSVVDVDDAADVDDRPARRLGDAHHGTDQEMEKAINDRMAQDKENYA